MVNQVPAVVCVSCRERIFFCKAVGRDHAGDVPQAEDFVPLDDSPPPRNGEAMICPKCGEMFFLAGEKGIILELEDGSWWPHPPI